MVFLRTHYIRGNLFIRICQNSVLSFQYVDLFIQVKSSPKQTAALGIQDPMMIPNISFFHPKWLDEKFKNSAGSVILDLRPNERANLKRLFFQSFSLDRCVTKWGDLVQVLLKAGITDFTFEDLKKVKSWHQLLIYFVNIIGQHQGWDPAMIAMPDETPPTS